jgi:hypothetical protein
MKVMNGSQYCDFSGLVFKSARPYIRLEGLTSLTANGTRAASQCLVTVLAYLLSQPQVW